MKNIFIRFLALGLILGVMTLSAAKKKPKAGAMKPVGDKPSISRIETRGIQRGIETKVKLVGTNLVGLTDLNFSNPKLQGEILENEEQETEAWIKVTAASDLVRGSYDLSVRNEKGESGKVNLYVDDLPQVFETATNDVTQLRKLPVTFWGTLDPLADNDEVEFQAKAGQSIVFDLVAKSIGSKANVMVSLFDAKGKMLANNNSFDAGDPLIVHTFSASGKYVLRISEETLAGSADHFYRLSIGEFPEVVGSFPLSVTTNAEAEVELIGYNLPGKSTVKFNAAKPGEMNVPLDLENFRTRKTLKVLVTDGIESVETEPNNSPSEANEIKIPGTIGGRINAITKGEITDADLFRFAAKAGQVLVIETDAARRGSPIDTKIEILRPNGKPVERLLLQAVRDSNVSFRPVDANTPDVRVENWEEMELNELMYFQGEVNKIFRMPQGPDSGFQLYSSAGKRHCYFDTSGIDHALDEPCYVVEPHPPGTKLIPNGLPVFPLYYSNDDGGERKIGTDSRVMFTAPATGSYLVRVTDTLEKSGERFAYRLTVREAQQDFKVTLNGANPTVPPGSGQELSFTADRIDGFENDITIDIAGLPLGLVASTPIVIQAGHFAASGTIFAAPDATIPETIEPIEITAAAMVNGKKVVKEVNSFGKIKLGEAPKLAVTIEPYVEAQTNFVSRSIIEKPQEITIAPGQIVPVWLKLKRTGHDELVTFTVENLPHGVIVDNIGLNGVLIPKGEDERQIFLRAAKWVSETDRLAYCQAKQAGNPTSLPIMIQVRRPSVDQVAASETR